MDFRIILLILLCLLLFFSCTSIQRHYMDNVDTKYKSIRTMNELIGNLVTKKKDTFFDTVIETETHSIPVRVYIPKELNEDAPLVLYMHGGGFVLGTYAQKHLVTKQISQKAHCIVVSINYALAPEYPYPEGLMDCLAVYNYFIVNSSLENCQYRDVIVAGDSAGASLSAVICQYQRDKGEKIPLAQILFSPATAKINPKTGEAWESRIKNQKKSFLTERSLEVFYDFYLEGKLEENLYNPYVFPLMTKDFSGLPPAAFVLCGKDPLYDEGLAYAQALQKEGRVEIREFKNKDHNYQGKEAIDFVVAFIKSIERDWGKDDKRKF